MAWTLDSYGECCPQSITLEAGRASTAVVTFPDSYSGTMPTEGEWLDLTDGATLRFHGKVVGPERVAGGVTSARAVVLVDLFESLERITYQQDWVRGDGAGGTTTVRLPTVQFGMNESGVRVTTLASLQDVITYAATAGLTISGSYGFSGRSVPVEEASNLTCAGAIARLLQWHPDVVPWVDHAGGGVTLTFTPALSLTTLTVALADGEARVRPASRAKPVGCRIVWQRVGISGIQETHVETAGTTGSGGAGEDVLNLIIDVEGPTPPAPPPVARIKTIDLPRYADSTAKKLRWLKYHLPFLRDETKFPPAHMEFGATEATWGITVVDPPAEADRQEDPDGEVTHDDYSTDPDDYPRELTKDSDPVPPWNTALESAPLRVSVKFKAGSSFPDSEEAQRIFGADLSDEYHLDIQVTGTDASTREYVGSVVYPPPPDWPADGLAQSLVDTVGVARYEGTYTTTRAECLWTARPGKSLRISGGETAWATMLAPISKVVHRPVSGTTEITFGPRATLGAQDLISLHAMARKVNAVPTSSASAARTEGKAATTGGTQGGKGRAAQSDAAGRGPGGAAIGWWPFKSAIVDAAAGTASFYYGTVAGLSTTAVGVSVAGTIPSPGTARTLTLPEATAGKIWLAMTVANNATTGELEVSAAALGAGGTLPSDTSTLKHVEVGQYTRPTGEDLADVVMFVETHLYGVRMGAPGATTHAVVARA